MAASISASAKDWSEPKISLFFYGTLIHPAVLRRVIGHDGQDLFYQPAILQDYTRHHVKGDTYPAIIPWNQARTLFSKLASSVAEPAPVERTVRGSLVTGFSLVDVDLLDIFEGDEYERQVVTVIPFGEQQPLNTAADDAGIVFESVTGNFSEEASHVKAQVYLWNKPPQETLEPTIWSYDAFVKDNLHKWVGSEVDRNSYADVDNARESVGIDRSIVTQRMQKNTSASPQDPNPVSSLEKDQTYVFGHEMLKHFCLEDGYVNLNNGSYGSCPRPVFEASHRISESIEANPDGFFRIKLAGMLIDVRTRLAKFINAKDVDDVVIIPNATHGVNNVLHNIDWKAGDTLIGFTTSYAAVYSTLQRYADAAPNPKLDVIRFAFPTTRDDLVSQFRSHIQGLERKPGTKAVAVIDGIISVPGAQIPWEDMVNICHENDVLSIVDGAHMIGQIPIDVQKSDPDFLITNCHKWMYTRRSCAILYVPKRNQQMMRWTFPISVGYIASPKEVQFADQYSWTGTIDYTAYLSVNAALDFREAIGGEQKIQAYCHGLARSGGKKMAQVLGTRLMDENDEFTASMVDVLLPIPESAVPRWGAAISPIIQQKLLEEWHCMSTVYLHEGRVWTRASAQIWSEESDFEYAGLALKSICDSLLGGSSNTGVAKVPSKEGETVELGGRKE